MILHNTHTQKRRESCEELFLSRGSKRREKREFKVTGRGRRKKELGGRKKGGRFLGRQAPKRISGLLYLCDLYPPNQYLRGGSEASVIDSGGGCQRE